MERNLPELPADPRKDIEAVAKFHSLPLAFPPRVLKEASSAAALAEARGKRLDLRRKFVFTCDPVSAKDYDDALSFEKDASGRRVLGVHIADVSHFVRPGGAIDKEAAKRGNSVYFPGRVLPMLPPLLSDNLCSLVPGEDRLAFSVFITFDAGGNVVGRSFAKSVIRSKARFEYSAVTAALRGESASIPAARLKTLRAINSLAAELRAKRFAAGALDLETPEYEMVLDGRGEMVRLEKRPYDESHIMIEECMVAANEAVAFFLASKGVRIPARFHDGPDGEKLRMLRAELAGMGVKTGNLCDINVFTRFLASVKKHPLYPVIAVMVLRSMKRAVYDAGSMGHFGLAKRYYAHFTSPIRRYADLVLHRILADSLSGKHTRMPASKLAGICAHLSETEETAAEAERELADMKKTRFMMKSGRKGEVYRAVVSKCMPFGCFVDIPSLGVSGLVHISSLSGRYVIFNSSDSSLSAPGGESWRTGDEMDVMLDRVDPKTRRIDFVPAVSSGRRARGGKKKGGGRWI